YNNSMQDLVSAERYYKEFIEKYPKHNMAPHAEFELQSLGMPIEDVFNKILSTDSTAVADSVAAP
ncbi:MAG: hypothetical protein AAF570_21110, partial [Bacteroidota bacterium]